MTTLVKENAKKETTTCQSNMEIAVYTIYDTVTKQFDLPFSIPQVKLYDYMSHIVNDVQSKFYGHESDYILYQIGIFDQSLGDVINQEMTKVNLLDFYIDKQKRNLQTVIQVLNYIPAGYYKMPELKKKHIQEKIDNAVTEYVTNYVLPDLDVSKYDMSKVRDIYEHYDIYTNPNRYGDDWDDGPVVPPIGQD